MVAAEDSYCTMVLMPRDCHLSKLPLGWDQAPMTNSGGEAEGLGWLVMRAKSLRDLSAVEAALSWNVRMRRRATLSCTRMGIDWPGASARSSSTPPPPPTNPAAIS